MSHLVTIPTKLHDAAAVAASCTRLGLEAPVLGKADVFSADVEGLIVKLPGWQYPVVIDTLTGNVAFDNYGEKWGEQAQLDRFLQAYAVEKAKLESRKAGHTFTETQLQNGAIKLTITEGW